LLYLVRGVDGWFDVKVKIVRRQRGLTFYCHRQLDRQTD